MRLKAIPAEAVEYAGKHPLVLVGAGVLVVGGYYLYVNRSPTDANDINPSASTMLPFSYGMPQMAPIGGGGGAGAVGGATNDAGIQQAIQAAQQAFESEWNTKFLNLETTKAANEYDIAKRSIDASLAISASNAAIALQGIQASNYQTSAMLAEGFIRSGSQFFAGNFGGQTIAMLQAAAPITTGPNSKTKTEMQQAQFESLLTNPNAINLMSGSYYGIQPSSGAGAITPYGSYSYGTASGAAGGFTYSTVAPATGSSSAQSAVSSGVSGAALGRTGYSPRAGTSYQ